jgi:hypothetical protein
MAEPGMPPGEPGPPDNGPGVGAGLPDQHEQYPAGFTQSSPYQAGYTQSSAYQAGYTQPSAYREPPAEPPAYSLPPAYQQAYVQPPTGPQADQQPLAYPAFEQGFPGSGGPYVPDYYQQPPQRMPRPSPFAGVPRSDFALDAASVAALVATLLMPWTVAGPGYSRVEVIVCVVLGVCAVTLPYLSRINLFGPSWTPAKLRVAKLIAAAPLGLCAATYFIIDAISGALNGGVTSFAPAPGAWIGTAGAVLAALPRRSDLIDAHTQGSARLWRTVLSGTCVVLVSCAGLALLAALFNVYRSLSAVLELRALLLLPVIHTLLLGVWVIAVWRVGRQAARGDAAQRLVLAAAGVGALTWAILAGVGQFAFGTAESLHLPFGGFTLTMVAGLVAVSPSLTPPGQQLDAQVWLAAVRSVLALVLIADVLLLAQVVVNLALTGALTAAVFSTAGCAGVGAVATDWARQHVALNPGACRIQVLIAAVVQAATGWRSLS